MKLRNQISYFRKKDRESLFEAYEGFNEMIWICPYHGLKKWLIIHTFYNGFLYNMRITLDAVVGGALMNNPFDEVDDLFKGMSQNLYLWGRERALVENSPQKGRLFEVSILDHMNAKVEYLYQKIDNLSITHAAIAAP